MRSARTGRARRRRRGIGEGLAGRVVDAIVEIIGIEPERTSCRRTPQQWYERICAHETIAVEPNSGVDEPFLRWPVLVGDRGRIEVRRGRAIRASQAVFCNHVGASTAVLRLTRYRAVCAGERRHGISRPESNRVVPTVDDLAWVIRGRVAVPAVWIF